MKKSVIVFALLAAVGIVAVACDNGDKKDACEKAADIMIKGMDEYCSGKSADCWSCDCYNRDLALNVTVDGTQVSYSCVAPDPAPDTTCDGTALDAANNCLNDKTVCQTNASNMVQSGCEATPK